MTPAVNYLGLSAEVEHVVGTADLAVEMGSGDVPVLATPRVLAWAEEASVAALAGATPRGRTTVGVEVAVQHLLASPLGATVRARASVTAADQRTISFDVVVSHRTSAGEQTVALASLRRALIDRAAFLSRLPAPD